MMDHRPGTYMKPRYIYGPTLLIIKPVINPLNTEATLVLSTRTKGFGKPSKPCHVGIH